MLLPIAHVQNGRFKAFFVTDIPLTASFRPPFNALWLSADSLEVFQLSCTPGFQLVSNIFRFSIGFDDDMDVIRSDVSNKQMPSAMSAMIDDRLMNKLALFRI